MPIDLSKTSTPLDSGALIPAGTIAPMQIRIKPGGHGESGLLTAAETAKGKSAYLHLEFVVTGGPAQGPQALEALDRRGRRPRHRRSTITLDLLGSLARSAYNFSAKDTGRGSRRQAQELRLRMLDSLRVIGKIGVERGKLDRRHGEK